MAEAKTVKTRASPAAFLAAVKDPGVRADCATLVRMMEKVTGEKAAMWGPSIVGFGQYRYVYASGRTGDWPLAAFSPRARNLTVYVMSGFDGHAALLRRLGRHTSSVSCLYIRSLADVDLAVLEELVARSAATVRAAHPSQAGARTTGKAKAAGPKAKPKAKAKTAVRTAKAGKAAKRPAKR